MIVKFMIKTLDSNNHHFSLDDDITILQLKEKVREQMGIELSLQRLIFCGRVLQDEKKLSEYRVDGKVIHLVQRAPPSPESRHTVFSSPTAASSNPENPNVTQQQIRRLMALSGPNGVIYDDHQGITISPTSGRIEFIRRVIEEIKTSIALLRAHVNREEVSGGAASSEQRTEQMEVDPPNLQQEQTEPTLEEIAQELPEFASRFLTARQRAFRVMRSRHARPRDLGQLIEHLEELQEEFVPYRCNYVQMLREASNPEPPQFSEEERARTQCTVDLTSAIMHSFAHAYHCISDINFQVGQRHPRLTSSAPVVVRHPLPMQAHINVVQTNPPRQTGPLPANTTATQTSDGENSGNGTGSSASAPPDPATSEPEQTLPNQAQPGRTAQPTVNIDPITYQVEIETRVPIAFALENAMFNGMINPAAANQRPEQAQAPPNILQHSNQAISRQILFDFENLIRGLGQAAGGVEVVMSMEEIVPSEGNNPSGPTAAGGNETGDGNAPENNATGDNAAHANANANAGNVAGGIAPGGDGTAGNAAVPNATLNGVGINIAHGIGAQGLNFGGISIGNATGVPLNINMHPADGGVFLAPMPWGGPPNADILQNIVSSVLRQGIVPGIDGVAVHAHIPLQLAQAQAQAQLQAAVLGIAPLSVPPQAPTAEPPAQAETSAASQRPVHGPPQIESSDSPGDEPGPPRPPLFQLSTPNQEPRAPPQSVPQRPPNLHFRRAANTRAHAMSLNNLIYDTFLPCDSPHARRTVLSRREQHTQQVANQERLRTERALSQGTEVLRNRLPDITADLMQILLQLLNAEPSQDSYLNALLVTVARHQFQPEILSPVMGEPPLIPNEFPSVRRLLRHYVQHMLLRSGDSVGDNAFEAAAEYLVTQYADFINNVIPEIATMKEEIDLAGSFRALIRSRLPAVIAAVMSESVAETLPARFYGVFSRLFMDVMAVIAYSSEEGVEGCHKVFREFLNRAIEETPEPTRTLFRIIGVGNMNIVALTLPGRYEAIQSYINRKDDMPTGRQRMSNEPIPMEYPTAEPERPIEMPTPVPAPEPAGDAAAAPYAPAPAPVTSAIDSDGLPSQASTSHGAIHKTKIYKDNKTSKKSSDGKSKKSSSGLPQSASMTHGSSSSRNTRYPKSESSSSSSPENRRDPNVRFISQVAPMLIVENWDTEWVGVLGGDSRAQTANREPYSDAYLSGMPSRKRRRLRHDRPPTTLDGFINETIGEVGVGHAVERSGLRQAFREHVRALARARATASPDFDPQRHVAAATFLTPTRSGKEQSESSNDSKENI